MTAWQVIGLVVGIISLVLNIIQHIRLSHMQKAFCAFLDTLDGQLGIASSRSQGLVDATQALAKPGSETKGETLRAVHTLSGDVRGSVQGAAASVQRFSSSYLHLPMRTNAEVRTEIVRR